MYGSACYGTQEYGAIQSSFSGPSVSIAITILRLPFKSTTLELWSQPTKIWQNNFGYAISFVLNDGTGNPVDLTGANLTLNVQSSQDPSGTDLALGGSMVVDDAVSGACHYQVASGDFANPSALLAQIS